MQKKIEEKQPQDEQLLEEQFYKGETTGGDWMMKVYNFTNLTFAFRVSLTAQHIEIDNSCDHCFEYDEWGIKTWEKSFKGICLMEPLSKRSFRSLTKR